MHYAFSLRKSVCGSGSLGLPNFGTRARFPGFLVYKTRKESAKALFSSEKDFLIIFFERNAYKRVVEPLEDFRGGQEPFSYSEEKEWDEEEEEV